MKIFVLGGDGFCGWPLSLALSAAGHDVLIIDNFCRRQIDVELHSASLTPICSLEERLRAWRSVTGRAIENAVIDIANDYGSLRDIVRAERPDAIVHLAEQRSVPYSMSSLARRRFTVTQNVGATHNVLAAIVDCGLDTHLVHLSSVGIYGYETLGYRVPDGYVDVTINLPGDKRERRVLHPSNPVSIYHLTKAQDQLLLEFYCKNDGVRVTDLVQGTVWGTQTAHSALDERLINRFDYDAVFGTVINRFVLQAVLGHPITVYGSGKQTRAFIHISDAINCIQLAVSNPPAPASKMRVLNQVSETQRIIDLAGAVRRVIGEAETQFIENPRHEPGSNSLEISNSGLSSLGFVPKKISDTLLSEMQDVVKKYASRCSLAQLNVERVAQSIE